MVTALLERLGPDDAILVIDDGSPDGTGALADRIAAAHDGRVAVLHRPAKEGLGPAYLAGFRRALSEGAELVLEMDCDFSHDPADVPRLIEATADADLVLGSRYVDGGRVEDWGAGRRFVSRASRRSSSWPHGTRRISASARLRSSRAWTGPAIPTRPRP